MEILLVGKRDYSTARELFPDRDPDTMADAVVAVVFQNLVGDWLKDNYPEVKSSYLVSKTGDDYLDGPGVYVKGVEDDEVARVKREIEDLLAAEGDNYVRSYFGK